MRSAMMAKDITVSGLNIIAIRLHIWITCTATNMGQNMWERNAVTDHIQVLGMEMTDLELSWLAF
jgi:hypothetical protein